MKLKLLLSIILLGSFLRLWQLHSIPSSLNWDEASLGYNAYSILITGKDEYGKLLPFAIRSFNDFKPPLLTYLIIPFIKLFGLNDFVVRLPSALCGILSIFGMYLLTKEILVLTTSEKNNKRNEMAGLLSAFIFSISPWSIQFSRGAFESNIALTCIIFSSLYFLKALQSAQFLLHTVFFSLLALYSYHSSRIFIPLMSIASVMLYFKDIKFNRKFTFISLIMGLILILPLFISLLDSTSLNRLKGTSAYSDQTGMLMHSVKRLEYDTLNNQLLGQIVNNRRIVWIKTFINGYIAHFSIKWMFLTGDNIRHHAPESGLLYIWMLPFICIGVYQAVYYYGKVGKWLLAWLLISPLPAAITTEVRMPYEYSQCCLYWLFLLQLV